MALYPEIYAEEDGREQRYILVGLGSDRSPLYRSNEEQALLIETGQGFTLFKSGGKRLQFSFEGKIVSKARNNQVQVAYHYDQETRLKEIVHAKGKKIEFLYEQDRIVLVRGPGDKCVLYSYDAEGQLSRVADSLGVLESYAYDSDKNLKGVSTVEMSQSLKRCTMIIIERSQKLF
jgi:YD repeat-containing protein